MMIFLENRVRKCPRQRLQASSFIDFYAISIYWTLFGVSDRIRSRQQIQIRFKRLVRFPSRLRGKTWQPWLDLLFLYPALPENSAFCFMTASFFNNALKLRTACSSLISFSNFLVNSVALSAPSSAFDISSNIFKFEQTERMLQKVRHILLTIDSE